MRGKPLLDQQPQNMSSVALVGLLFAHIAGPDLGRIADPQFVAQPLHQLLEPQRITDRLHAHQRRGVQFPVEPLGISCGMNQPALLYFPGRTIKNRYLLEAGMKITSYNLHKAPLLRLRLWFSKPTKVYPDSIGAFRFIPSTGA